jgi:hypothetical protein
MILVEDVLPPEADLSKPVTFTLPVPVGRRGSFTGSGIPHGNARAAFFHGRAGIVEDLDHDTRRFRVHIEDTEAQTAFLADDGTLVRGPAVRVTFVDLRDGFKTSLVFIARESEQHKRAPPHHRNLGAWPSDRRDASFYDDRGLPVRSQEQILRDASYKRSGSGPGFWGWRPRR